MQEMDNAVNQVKKEIDQRYDFRGSNASIELGEKEVKIAAEDEYKLGAILDMLRQKMAKRGIPLRCLVPGKIEPAAKGTVRQSLEIQQGISKENGKKIVAAIKASKLKVTAQIQDDQVRVAGAKKDDLQAVIQLLKAEIPASIRHHQHALSIRPRFGKEWSKMTEHKDFDKKKINDGELQKYSGSYSEEGLLHKISRYGAHIGIELLYKVVQLWCVLQKPEVPAKEKALIMGALGYLIALRILCRI